jgi:diguanylate cyclase (GGDEF)-like protein
VGSTTSTHRTAASSGRELLGSAAQAWSRAGGEPSHADRPPTPEEAREVLAATLGIDRAELGSLSSGGAVTALSRLSELVRRLAEQAATDELTGAMRRGAGYAAARGELERARRTDAPLSLVVVDVDGLKRINDGFGHLRGDLVLRRVAGELSSAMRPYDVLIRFGGDEFLCVLSGVARAQARRRITTVRAKLAADGISVSAGVAQLAGTDSLDDLISRADAQLYAGRSRRRVPSRGRGGRPPGAQSSAGGRG